MRDGRLHSSLPSPLEYPLRLEFHFSAFIPSSKRARKGVGWLASCERLSRPGGSQCVTRCCNARSRRGAR